MLQPIKMRDIIRYCLKLNALYAIILLLYLYEGDYKGAANRLSKKRNK